MALHLRIGLFGVLRVFHASGGEITLGAKHQALLVLLATAGGGGRTRFFLEKTLWSRSQPEQARASLRTSLSTLRKKMGVDAGSLVVANRERIVLDLDGVDLVGTPNHGVLMDGFKLNKEPNFNDWLEVQRGEMFYENEPIKIKEVDALDVSRQMVGELAPKISVLPLISTAAKKLPVAMGTLSTMGVLLTEELVRHLQRSQVFEETSQLAPKKIDSLTMNAHENGLVTNASYHLSCVLKVEETKRSMNLTLFDVANDQILWGGYSEGNLAHAITEDAALFTALGQQISQAIIHNLDSKSLHLQTLRKRENHTLVVASISGPATA